MVAAGTIGAALPANKYAVMRGEVEFCHNQQASLHLDFA